MSSDTPDLTLPPPPGAMVQAAALRAAFGDRYIVNVLRSHGEPVRFEVVARDSDNPLYCLISTDALEIWRELRAASKRAALNPGAG